jgi:REP element-mobilizing transposase RayT
MSRRLRIEYPGAMCHFMSRGDQREDIFRDDEDRQRFLSTLGEASGKTEWQVPAYCLMRNHFLQWTRRQPNPSSVGTRPGRLDLLILPEGERQGRWGECPVLG